MSRHTWNKIFRRYVRDRHAYHLHNWYDNQQRMHFIFSHTGAVKFGLSLAPINRRPRVCRKCCSTQWYEWMRVNLPASVHTVVWCPVSAYAVFRFTWQILRTLNYCGRFFSNQVYLAEHPMLRYDYSFNNNQNLAKSHGPFSNVSYSTKS